MAISLTLCRPSWADLLLLQNKHIDVLQLSRGRMATRAAHAWPLHMKRTASCVMLLACCCWDATTPVILESCNALMHAILPKIEPSLMSNPAPVVSITMFYKLVSAGIARWPLKQHCSPRSNAYRAAFNANDAAFNHALYSYLQLLTAQICMARSAWRQTARCNAWCTYVFTLTSRG